MTEADLITVTAGRNVRPGRIAIIDEDQRHPPVRPGGAHVVVVKGGGDPVRVARTQAVNAALGDGRLTEMDPAPKRRRGKQGEAQEPAPVAEEPATEELATEAPEAPTE
jgi:hypothetical protein